MVLRENRAHFLLDRAAAVRQAVHGNEVSLCGITNAKSGSCPEDCGFCSQSAHFQGTGAPVYPMMEPREIAEQLAGEIAGAQLQWLERLGHFPMLEDPLGWSDPVVRWLAPRPR